MNTLLDVVQAWVFLKALLWQVLNPEFQRTWINTHEIDARNVLHKPVRNTPDKASESPRILC